MIGMSIHLGGLDAEHRLVSLGGEDPHEVAVHVDAVPDFLALIEDGPGARKGLERTARKLGRPFPREGRRC